MTLETSPSKMEINREEYFESKDLLSALPKYQRENILRNNGQESPEPIGPEGLSGSQERLARMLYDIGAVKFGNFKLNLHDEYPDAPLSPIYIDLRLLKRHPREKSAATRLYQEALKPLEFDLLADVPTAITPIVSTLSDRLGVGMISPRPDTKSHGTGTKVEGLKDYDKGKAVVLIDDLLTKGISSKASVQTLRESGLVVKNLVVLIDREQGGKEQLGKEGIDVHSEFTLDQMLSLYLRDEKINKNSYKEVKLKIAELNKYRG